VHSASAAAIVRASSPARGGLAFNPAHQGPSPRAGCDEGREVVAGPRRLGEWCRPLDLGAGTVAVVVADVVAAVLHDLDLRVPVGIVVPGVQVVPVVYADRVETRPVARVIVIVGATEIPYVVVVTVAVDAVVAALTVDCIGSFAAVAIVVSGTEVQVVEAAETGERVTTAEAVHVLAGARAVARVRAAGSGDVRPGPAMRAILVTRAGRARPPEQSQQCNRDGNPLHNVPLSPALTLSTFALLTTHFKMR
jgi:hypothetical protein